MNQEIKFRAKRTPSGDWVYGDLEYSMLKCICRIHTYNADGSYFRQYEVNPNTVGQFSGLCDKNGADIYEGDIVLWSRDNQKYVVKFWQGMFYASVEEFNDGVYGGFPLWALCDKTEDWDSCMIVGTIYDDGQE